MSPDIAETTIRTEIRVTPIRAIAAQPWPKLMVVDCAARSVTSLLAAGQRGDHVPASPLLRVYAPGADRSAVVDLLEELSPMSVRERSSSACFCA